MKHIQSLLEQIKKLKHGKKTQPKLDPHVNKEPSTDKESMNDLVEVGILSNVEVPTKENPSVSTHKHIMINCNTPSFMIPLERNHIPIAPDEATWELEDAMRGISLFVLILNKHWGQCYSKGSRKKWHG